MAKKIYVGRISPETTDQKLYEHFAKMGKVISASTVKGIGASNHSGYGYVIMASDKETETAVIKLNNSLLDGSRLKVVVAHPLDQEKKQYYYRRY